MNIVNYKLHSRKELFDVIRKTSLLGDSSILPFADADISLQKVSYRDLVPTQSFVLKSQLKKIQEIYKAFLQRGINIFDHHGFLSYTLQADDTPFVFTPPIVEVIDNQPLIVDGMHRVKFNAENRQTFLALIIENTPAEYYPYQIPLGGTSRGGVEPWALVQEFEDELPDGFVRKERRYQNGTHKYYFREYPFPGVIKLERTHTGR